MEENNNNNIPEEPKKKWTAKKICITILAVIGGLVVYSIVEELFNAGISTVFNTADDVISDVRDELNPFDPGNMTEKETFEYAEQAIREEETAIFGEESAWDIEGVSSLNRGMIEYDLCSEGTRRHTQYDVKMQYNVPNEDGETYIAPVYVTLYTTDEHWEYDIEGDLAEAMFSGIME